MAGNFKPGGAMSGLYRCEQLVFTHCGELPETGREPRPNVDLARCTSVCPTLYKSVQELGNCTMNAVITSYNYSK